MYQSAADRRRRLAGLLCGLELRDQGRDVQPLRGGRAGPAGPRTRKLLDLTVQAPPAAPGADVPESSRSSPG